MKTTVPKILSYISILVNVYALIMWLYTFLQYDSSVASEEYFDHIAGSEGGIIIAGVQLLLILVSLVYFWGQKDDRSRVLFWVQIIFLLFFCMNLA